LAFGAKFGIKSKDLEIDVRKSVRQAAFWGLKRDKYAIMIASCVPIIAMCQFLTQYHSIWVLGAISFSCSILLFTFISALTQPPWRELGFGFETGFGLEGLNKMLFVFVGATGVAALGAKSIGIEQSSSQNIWILIFSILLFLKALFGSSTERQFSNYAWNRVDKVKAIKGVRHVDAETIFYILCSIWGITVIAEIVNVLIYKTIWLPGPLKIIACGICIISILMSILAFRGWERISTAARIAMELEQRR
jgi:hypothetical protein